MNLTIDNRPSAEMNAYHEAAISALRREIIRQRAENLQLRIDLDREKHRGESWMKSLVDQLAEANTAKVELQKQLDIVSAAFERAMYERI